MPAENVLLLPGMMCDARLWAPQAEALDLPVFHADTTNADNFGEMARVVLADAPPTFAMAGLSMGGILAFEIWRQAPERVTHMALLDTTPHPDTPTKRNTRLEQINIAIQGGLRELAVESLKPLCYRGNWHERKGATAGLLRHSLRGGCSTCAFGAPYQFHPLVLTAYCCTNITGEL